MFSKAEIATSCLLLIGAVYCVPAGKGTKETAISCPSTFCESAKYECSPVPSCQMVSDNETRKLECHCCQLCLIEEGDRCIAEGLAEEDKEKPPKTSAQAISEGIIKAEEKINKGKQCKQGLMCLLGTCVTVF